MAMVRKGNAGWLSGLRKYQEGGAVDDQKPDPTRYDIGKGDPVFPIGPNDNIITGGAKIIAEPYAEVIRKAYHTIKGD